MANTVNKISEEKRKELAAKSPLMLPDNPTNRGFLPSIIKNRFINYVLDNKVSIYEEINRICDEINEGFSGAKLELDTLYSSLESTINAKLEVQEEQIFALQELINKYIDIVDIKQSLGESEVSPMSQNAVTEAIKKNTTIVYDEEAIYNDFDGLGQIYVQLEKDEEVVEETNLQNVKLVEEEIEIETKTKGISLEVASEILPTIEDEGVNLSLKANEENLQVVSELEIVNTEEGINLQAVNGINLEINEDLKPTVKEEANLEVIN